MIRSGQHKIEGIRKYLGINIIYRYSVLIKAVEEEMEGTQPSNYF